MDEEQRPFACGIDSCGMSFTNEDHLNVHRKKHDMVLHLGLGSAKSGIFLADQTPTPTRLIRNCEEVGLFDDLQHVNPFEETFRRAVESKDISSNQSRNSLDTLSLTGDETLHTPHVMPYFNMTNTSCTNKDDQSSAIKGVSDELKIPGKCDRQTSEAEMLLYLSKVNSDDSRELASPIKSTKKSPDLTLSNEATNRASVIYVPQVTPVVQPVSGVIYEISPKKFKPILPLAQPKVPQIITVNAIPVSNSIVNNNRTKLFKKICPKVGEEVASKTISANKMVKEKLKEALLKLKFNTDSIKSQVNHSDDVPQVLRVQIKSEDSDSEVRLSSAAPNHSSGHNRFANSATSLTKQATAEMTDDRNKSQNQSQNDKLNEKNRAAAAAKRYRAKFKNQHNDLKRKNADLETENERLRSELRAVKTILLAHQDCSVTRAMAMGNVFSLGTIANDSGKSRFEKSQLVAEEPPVFVILAKDGEENVK